MNTTQADIQRIQTRLQALGQTNRRVATTPSPPSPQPSISLPTAYPRGSDRPTSRRDLNSGSIPHHLSPPNLSSKNSSQNLSPGLSNPPAHDRECRPSPPVFPEQVQAQPPSQPTPQPSHPESFPESIDAAFQLLDVQVQQVNSMSQALETALQDAAIIAQHLNQQRVQAAIRGQKTRLDHLESPLVYDPQHIHPEQSCLPQIHRNGRGEFVLTGRPLAWRGQAQTSSRPVTRSQSTHPQQEAGAIATHLRHRKATQAAQASLKSQSFLNAIVRWFNPSHGSVSPAFAAHSSHAASSAPFSSTRHTIDVSTIQPAPPINSHRAQHRPSQHSPATSSTAPVVDTISGGLLFVGGAAIARVGMDQLLILYPMLWPIVIALVVTPAAIAIYRSTVNPQSSFVLGRRLLFIMIGLLIGGRL